MGVLLYADSVIPLSIVLASVSILIFGYSFVNIVIGIKFPSAPMSTLNTCLDLFWLISQLNPFTTEENYHVILPIFAVLVAIVTTHLIQVFPLNSNMVNSNFLITQTFLDIPFVCFLFKIDWLT